MSTDIIATDLHKNMTDSLESITTSYAGKRLYKTKRERYQDEWQTSPAAVGIEIERVAFTYELARIALWVMVTGALSQKGKTFTISAKASDRLTQIIKTITGDTTGRYAVQKGIYLQGQPSSGKTFIMRSICSMVHKAYYTGWYNQICLPYWFSYKELMLRARREGSIAFLNEIFRDKKMIFLDDLGYVDDVQINLYGNKEVVIVHLIDILYRMYTDKGAMIYITSNVDISTIQSSYGQATSDRLMEMVTPVTWTSGINFRTGQKVN